MAAEVRSEHHRELERLDIALGALLAVIPDAVEHATASLLSGDAALHAEVDRWEEMVVAISDDVDSTAEVIIARQSPMAGELRFVLTCVRLVLSLSDTIGLVSEIGGSAALSPEGSVVARVQPMLADIGHEASVVWSAVSELWHDPQPDTKAKFRHHEDHVSETRASLAAELAATGADAFSMTELGIVVHCYDRIIRHAVSASALIDGLPHPGGYRQREEGGGAEGGGDAEGAAGEDQAGGSGGGDDGDRGESSGGGEGGGGGEDGEPPAES